MPSGFLPSTPLVSDIEIKETSGTTTPSAFWKLLKPPPGKMSSGEEDEVSFPNLSSSMPPPPPTPVVVHPTIIERPRIRLFTGEGGFMEAEEFADDITRAWSLSRYSDARKLAFIIDNSSPKVRREIKQMEPAVQADPAALLAQLVATFGEQQQPHVLLERFYACGQLQAESIMDSLTICRACLVLYRPGRKRRMGNRHQTWHSGTNSPEV